MSRPLRVLAVVWNPIGGIRAYMKYTYGALDPARFHFTVAAIRTEQSDRLHSELAGLPVSIFEFDHAADLTNFVLRQALIGAHDVIHSHGLKSAVCASPAAWVTSLLPFVKPLPHVITSHYVFLPREFAGAKGRLMRACLTFVLNRASVVHSVSEGADKNLAVYLPGVRARRRRVVMSGIPAAADDDPEQARDWRRNMGPREETLFGFFGRFMPEKGFEYVIAAVQRLQDNALTRDRFRVVAVNDGGYIRERRAEVERLGLAERFVFAGASNQSRILMSRVDAVLMPSLWEACGLVAMEALWAGTPLISTAVHGLADVTAGSPAIIVEPRDSEGLSEAMTLIIERGEERRSAALAYRDTARRRFHASAAAAGLENIFNEVLPPSELRN